MNVAGVAAAASGLVAFAALPASAAPPPPPGQHPIQCSVSADPPSLETIGGKTMVHVSGTVQCSEPVLSMSLQLVLTTPSAGTQEAETGPVLNTSVDGFSTDMSYAGPGEYGVEVFGDAVPYPNQENGILSSDVKTAML